MNDFTQDELTLMSIYNSAGTRQGLIDSLADMRQYLDEDEVELRKLTDSTLIKLSDINDAEFLTIELLSHLF